MTLIQVPAQVCLLRHGTTPWNRAGRFCGRTDLGLDAEGAPSLVMAAELIAEFAPEQVLSSPALRARQTVEQLEQNGALGGIPHQIDDELRELDFGQFEGLTRREIAEGVHASRFERWLRPEYDFPSAPDGESFTSAARRAGRVLERARRTASRTLIVSHGYLLKILLATAVAGEDPGDVRGTHLGNGEPVFLDYEPGAGWARSPARVGRGA